MTEFVVAIHILMQISRGRRVTSVAGFLSIRGVIRPIPFGRRCNTDSFGTEWGWPVRYVFSMVFSKVCTFAAVTRRPFTAQLKRLRIKWLF
jgi:hypothetical protein